MAKAKAEIVLANDEKIKKLETTLNDFSKLKAFKSKNEIG